MKIPTGEKIVITCCPTKEKRFVITQKIQSGGLLYTLYSDSGGDYTRLGKTTESPLELEKKYRIWD